MHTVMMSKSVRSAIFPAVCTAESIKITPCISNHNYQASSFAFVLRRREGLLWRQYIANSWRVGGINSINKQSQLKRRNEG